MQRPPQVGLSDHLPWNSTPTVNEPHATVISQKVEIGNVTTAMANTGRR
jgi:hypothetical protein